MWILILLACGCLSGFLLFRRNTVAESTAFTREDVRLSVIIPARNEAFNLPLLLDSLQAQTYRPFEIIVVNDASTDRTKEIAEGYYGVKVVDNSPPPLGWTGKNWAVWKGYRHAAGTHFLFLDADIRLAPSALASVLRAREEAGGVISIVPYHQMNKFYEKLALVTNILGIFAFMSPFEKNNPRKGLYGSFILASRQDYESVGGHQTIKSEVLDDLNLGSRFCQAGIKVTNFIGHGLVSFRMYPQGLKSELQGFAKGAALSTSKLRPLTIVLIALWVVGLLASETVIVLFHTSYAWPLAAGYLLYAAQILWFVKVTGTFRIVMPVLHVLSALFFIAVMLYSLYQVVFRRKVIWKGRQIPVGGRKNR